MCSAYLPFDSEGPPPVKGCEEHVRYCDEERHLSGYTVTLQISPHGVN